MKKKLLMFAAIPFAFVMVYLAYSFVTLDLFWLTKVPQEGRAFYLMFSIIPSIGALAYVDINVKES